LSGEGNGGEGIGDSVVMAAAYEPVTGRQPVERGVVVMGVRASCAVGLLRSAHAARSIPTCLRPVGVQLIQVLVQEPVHLLGGGNVFVVEAAVCP
jgi:hypothetical protein